MTSLPADCEQGKYAPLPHDRGGSKRPCLSDLRDWYQLECFSSMVMFVYRPEYYYLDTFEDNSPSEEMADIMVEKNDFGDTGFVRMHFENHAGFREIS
ncbi:MAG: DnaB-like helicase C-terminal domain-containing protein [Bacteroidales bacterium]|nr:DnaB-like helicase C-terminal domain-containing protein [Bacteroidales bacterium]